MKQKLIPFLAWLASLAIALFVTACGSTSASQSTVVSATGDGPISLDKYWYQGKAEVTSYELSQARYSESHPGDAVLIFVAEDFLTDKQVKNESYNSDASTKILKANMLRKFPTGIYDYSIMTSVFSPADTRTYPHTMKVTMSAQDWCGQAFVQLNHRDNGFQLQQFSYFEQEGDVDKTMSGDMWLEDELWPLLRMDPYSLPTGTFNILPSLMTLRLLHMKNEAQAATGDLGDYIGEEFSGGNLKAYTLRYAKPARELQIVFESVAPYQIVGWTETSPAMFGGGELRTLARKKQTMLTDYWAKHNLQDSVYRKQLGL